MVWHRCTTINHALSRSKYNGNYGFILKFTEFRMKFLYSLKKRSERKQIMDQSADK